MVSGTRGPVTYWMPFEEARAVCAKLLRAPPEPLCESCGGAPATRVRVKGTGERLEVSLGCDGC